MIDVEALHRKACAARGNGGNTRDDREIVRIAPPVPAPYLRDARQLDDELLAAIPPTGHMIRALEDRVTAEIYSLAAELHCRREEYNTAHSVMIEPHTGSDRTTCPRGVF
jgi:hypothetical protein